VLISLNSHPLNDVIDFMFHKGISESRSVNETLAIEIKRNGNYKKLEIMTSDESDIGLTVKPFKVKTCKNNCIFCFVKQLPRGLRKSLYVKDEDYRLSFLYGNYITLANLDNEDRKRIVEKRLSPLYISVHTTDKSLRNKMLNNPRAADILKEIRYFSERKIRMHNQIVLCPGYNDGKELQRTIKDLYKFYPYVSSIAVVPVGLTKYSKANIRPVTKEDAYNTVKIVGSLQKRFKKKHGDSIVYCADEMYIKADLPFPKLSEYGTLPQIENGVGMVPLFLSKSKKVKTENPLSRTKRFLTFTGVSFYPFLKKFIDNLRESEGINIDLIPIENKFFGPSVTVTGLLTGRDVITKLRDIAPSYDILIVPDDVLDEENNQFLDNVSLTNIEEAIDLKVVITDISPQGFVETLSGFK
jgi:putative radical SAM enzyme (TIGR03279 family)